MRSEQMYTDGATARAIAPEAAPSVPKTAEGAPRRRTALSIVPSVGKNRRLPFLILCVTFLAAALTSVLLLNIQVSSGQYELVKLRSTERALTQENEALNQQVQYLEAPQNVAAKAANLGMVPAGDVASIDVSRSEVSGVATPAEAGNKVTSLVNGPPVPLEASDAQKKSEAAKSATSDQAAEAKAPTADEKKAGSTQAGNEKPDTEAGERPKFTDSELNGGSIPAPSLQGAE